MIRFIKIDWQVDGRQSHRTMKTLRTSERSTCAALHPILSEVLGTLELPPAAADRLTITGDESLPSCFPVTDLAVAAISAAGLAASELLGTDGRPPLVTVDQHLASAWFTSSLRPQGWELPAAWDAIAGDYRTADGWIRLHTNAPRHRAAALAVLGCAGEREAVSAAVSRLSAEALEDAILRAGGCAAAMRGMTEWRDHSQGRAVGAEPLVALKQIPAPPSSWRPDADRPLAGVRVLDLTRILAGPIATRFLAGLGADVLRIDPQIQGQDMRGAAVVISAIVPLAAMVGLLNTLRSHSEGQATFTAAFAHYSPVSQPDDHEPPPTMAAALRA